MSGPKETISDTLLSPHVRAIAEICLRHGINFLACFELDRHPKHGVTFVTSCQLMPGADMALVRAAYSLVPELDRASEASAEAVQNGEIPAPIDIRPPDARGENGPKLIGGGS